MYTKCTTMKELDAFFDVEKIRFFVKSKKMVWPLTTYSHPRPTTRRRTTCDSQGAAEGVGIFPLLGGGENLLPCQCQCQQLYHYLQKTRRYCDQNLAIAFPGKIAIFYDHRDKSHLCEPITKRRWSHSQSRFNK